MAGAPQPALVFFDGRCGFCRGQVAGCQRRMRPGALHFVDNGSPEGLATLGPLGLVEASASSLIVLDGEAVFTKSRAGLAIAKRFRWPWRAFVALKVLPRPWLDRAYDAVAARRQRDEACDLATPRKPAAP